MDEVIEDCSKTAEMGALYSSTGCADVPCTEAVIL